MTRSRFSRRALIGAGVATAALATWKRGRTRDSRIVIAGAENRSGHFFALAVSPENQLHFALPVATRLHGAVQHPVKPERVIVVARRPGTELNEIDIREQRIVRRVAAGPGRHFYGHAAFTRDGQYLLTTENAYASGTGKIAVRRTDDYSQVEEYESGGIGPHDLQLLGDGRTLVVANGGIRTHPAEHRRKLNLDSMQPSLVYIDIDSGRLIDEYRLDNPKLSIRHLRVAADDRVLIALQYEGDPSDVVPLLGLHAGQSSIETLHAPPGIAKRMLGYSSEAAFDATETEIYLALPRAGLLARFDSLSREFIDVIAIEQATSVCADPMNFETGLLVASKTQGLRRPVSGPSRPAPGRYRMDDHALLLA